MSGRGKARFFFAGAAIITVAVLLVARFGPGFVGGLAAGVVLGVGGVVGGMVLLARKVRGGALAWERRLPEMTSPWTHWRILGDEEPIADIPAADPAAAVHVVEQNAQKFKSISAMRVAIDATGRCTLDAKTRFHIASRQDAVDS